MIHGAFGKLGSGKGVWAIELVYFELLGGLRNVVTNLPVMTLPWVNGNGEPQIGLRSYIEQQQGKFFFDFEIDEMLKGLLVVPEVDHGHDLFMHRRDGDTGEWFKLETNHSDEKGRADRFDAEIIKKRRCKPNLVITDEAWQFYPNNGGYSRSPLLPFYARQQRKLCDTWYIVTQHFDDIDSMVWKIAQDFTVCRNHGFERIGIFRQPKIFSRKTYRSNPYAANAVMTHEWIGRLVKVSGLKILPHSYPGATVCPVYAVAMLPGVSSIRDITASNGAGTGASVLACP